MKPDIWGKFMWYSIHFIALDYSSNPSESEKIDYKYYFQNLYKVLPCYNCAQNYIEHLKENPITDNVMKDTKSLFNWTVELHNIVNKMLGKELWDTERAWSYYNNPKNFSNHTIPNVKFDTNKTSNSNIYWILCCVLFVLLLISVTYILYKIKT